MKKEEETEAGRSGKAILHEAAHPKRLSIVFRNGSAFIIYRGRGSKYGLISGSVGGGGGLGMPFFMKSFGPLLSARMALHLH